VSELVGKVLDGRYELLEAIGEGGVGMVYRARRMQLDRIVAVKVLHDSLADSSDFVGRFEREAVAMSRLYHPHCVAVIDSGVYGSRPYLVLEYLHGKTLKDLIEEKPLEAKRAVNITLQLLETLEYFHGHHVIHRDLKSENVMLVEASETRDFVKVLDFGMAKVLEGPGADSQLSVMGILPGTPSAMAPEQIQQLPPDPRIDVYATGILLYEMISGDRPFRDEDMAKVIKMQLAKPATPLREVAGEAAASPQLEAVVMRALEKNRDARFAGAPEMAAALRETPEARALSSDGAPADRTTAARPRWPLAVATLAIAGLGAVLGVQLWPNPPSAPAQVAPAPPPPPPDPTVVPEPEPVVAPWLAHRDLAITYSERNQHEQAFREITAAVEAAPDAAVSDGPLVVAAVKALQPDRLEFVMTKFRDNPKLVESLVEASADESAELRHAAYAGLVELGEQERADRVAMLVMDIKATEACNELRSLFKELKKLEDERIGTLVAELNERDRKDPQRKCLKRMLR